MGFIWEGQLALGTSAFCNVILSWCSRALYKLSLLAGGGSQSVLGSNIFCGRSYCPGVVGLCTTGLN